MQIKIILDKGMSEIFLINKITKEISINSNINIKNNDLNNNNNKDTNNSSFDYNDTELNALSYDDALRQDQRTYI